MADSKMRRLPAGTLQADLDAYAALQAISGYDPANADFSMAHATVAKTAMQTEQTAETQAQAAAKAARDAATAAEWAFHDLMIGVKNQVKAQFGDSSDELQAIGLKKKTEYKKGGKKTTTTP